MKRFLCVIFCLLLPLAVSAETQIVTLTVTGDFLPGSNQPVSTQDYAFQRYIEQYGWGYPFEGIRQLTENDDITLVNLECVLYEPPQPKYARNVFTGPPEYARILAENSVEIVNLANNHIADYDKAGYRSTIAALEAEGIRYCGDTIYGQDLYWFDFPHDVRIGFIGVVPLYYADNPHRVQQDFRALRDAGCDVIIASLHCGQEKHPYHTDIQEKYRRICMENGAHIIVGHHPHVPQGVHVQNGVTQLYSLGNFSFGGNTGVDEYLYSPAALVAQIALHFDDGQYTGHQVTLWPIRITGAEAGSGRDGGRRNDYQPVLLDGADAQAVMQLVQKDTAFPLVPYEDGLGAVQEFVPWTGQS